MTSTTGIFLLKCHSDKRNLKSSLNRFERRVKSLKYPFQFLEHLLDVKMENKVFYWPSVIDDMTMAEGSQSIPPGEILSMDEKNRDLQLYTLDVNSLVNIITASDQVISHHKRDTINDDDIVYPTFVNILYDRQLSVMKKLMETQSQLYTLKSKTGRIQVNPNSNFLDTIENDLLTINSSSAIYQKYKRTSFTHFVAENREALNHFARSTITPYTHKAIFDLNGMIWDATGICGGSITLYPLANRDEKYFVCLSDGSFHIDKDDNCELYTQSIYDKYQVDEIHSRWIDITRFASRRPKNDVKLSSLSSSSSSSPQQLFMVESSDKIVIRFNEKTRCLLYTSGRIHLDLTVVESMEFWSPSKVNRFPFPYHIHSIRMELHQQIMRILNNSSAVTPSTVNPKLDEYLRQFDECNTTNGVITMADVVRNEKTGMIEYLKHYMRLKNANRLIYDQHDSFISFDHEPQFTLLKNMKIYFTHSSSSVNTACKDMVNDIYPVFSTIVKRDVYMIDKLKNNRSKKSRTSRGMDYVKTIDEVVELSVKKERYRVGEQEYYVNGLYFPKKKDEIIAYFYLNPKNNHILFILPYASSSHLLNTEPIPVESQFSVIERYIEPVKKQSPVKQQQQHHHHHHHHHDRNKENNSRRGSSGRYGGSSSSQRS